MPNHCCAGCRALPLPVHLKAMKAMKAMNAPSPPWQGTHKYTKKFESDVWTEGHEWTSKGKKKGGSTKWGKNFKRVVLLDLNWDKAKGIVTETWQPHPWTWFEVEWLPKTKKANKTKPNKANKTTRNKTNKANKTRKAHKTLRNKTKVHKTKPRKTTRDQSKRKK